MKQAIIILFAAITLGILACDDGPECNDQVNIELPAEATDDDLTLEVMDDALYRLQEENERQNINR